MIRAILFDKDGTLTDFRATWEAVMPGIVRDLSRDSGADADIVAAAFGIDLAAGRIHPEGRFVTATGPETNAAVARAVGWTPDRMARWIAPRLDGVRQVPVGDVAGLMGRLRGRGLRLGVLTNAGRVEAGRHLAELGAAPHLERVIAHDSGFGAKPDPAGAAAFARGLGLDPSQVALVGDGLTDMAAAAGAGLVAVGVLTGTLDRAALAAQADAVLADIHGLPDWLSAFER